jgi:SAM-dependent methyltransferase
VSLPLTGERTVPGVPAENYWFRRHVAAYRFARKVVRGRVLDAGGGEGYGTAMLGAIGLDLDPSAAAHASRRYAGTPVVRGDLCRLPVRDRSLDAVVALQVIEHLPCAEEFVANAHRVLRPGGVLVLSTPNRDTFPAGLNPWHVHEYDAAELGVLLGSRFEQVRLLGVEHRLPLRLLDRALGEAVQARLVRVEYGDSPGWLRTVLRTVTSRDFRVTGNPGRSLDLLAVCRYGGGR